jgi:Cu+-exporting ATPase
MTAPLPTIEIVSFPVEGMTCASCVNRITRFLQKVDGVEDANVNLASESATVRFDPARVSTPDLIAAVDAAGYVARVDRPPRPPPHRTSRRSPMLEPSATRPPRCTPRRSGAGSWSRRC